MRDPDGALYRWLMSEAPSALGESVEIWLGTEKLEANEWYICNGKVVIDCLRPSQHKQPKEKNN